MTDVYNPQAPQQEQPQQESIGGGRGGYHGRVAQMRDGSYAVWQEQPSGRGGRFVRLSPETADQSSRDQLKAEQGLLSTLRETSRLSEDFIEHNLHSGTGGLGQSTQSVIGLDIGVPAFRAPHRQAMQGLSASMVRANVRPGTSTTMNSDAEQLITARSYPSEESGGDINAERAVRILVNRDVQTELVRQMEDWLRTHTSIAGFQEVWQRAEPQIRSAITAQHVRSFGSRGYNMTNLNERGIYEPGAGAHRRPLQQQDGVVQFTRDPRTGEIRRAQ